MRVMGVARESRRCCSHRINGNTVRWCSCPILDVFPAENSRPVLCWNLTNAAVEADVPREWPLLFEVPRIPVKSLILIPFSRPIPMLIMSPVAISVPMRNGMGFLQVHLPVIIRLAMCIAVIVYVLESCSAAGTGARWASTRRRRCWPIVATVRSWCATAPTNGTSSASASGR